MNTGTESPTSPATIPTAPQRRGSTLRWLWAALAVGLVLMLIAALMVQGLSAVPTLDVTIDGERVVSGWAIGQEMAGLPPLHKVALAGVLMVALLAAVIVVPLALAIAGIALVFVMLLVVGIPLLVGLSTVALVLSPLLLVGWLVWKAAT